MFVGDHVLLDLSFPAAGGRLADLASAGSLLCFSEESYGEGIAGFVEVAGPQAGTARLAGVIPGVLALTGGCARLTLTWEAIGADGQLFPALEADITLTPAGEQTTVLAVAGAYRPPPGLSAAGLDVVIADCYAAASIRSFIARLACALVHPAGSRAPGRLDGHRPRQQPPGG